ncbi:MAG: ABC transporter substrate-binding protein [Fimbriimonadaceae bacterium]|nr:MAG: ABC transporter substrate-binding protein [Fimbriimonadaceae bacterium]
MNRAVWCLAPILALITLTGCNSDDLGGKPRKEPPIRAYVSLSPSTTELITAAGVPATSILGITSSCNYPVTKAQIVVHGTEPNFEKIAALNPQRVILEKDLYGEQTISKLKELGFDPIVVETNTLESYEEWIIKISKLSGSETAATGYLDKVYAGLSSYEGTVKKGIKICVITGNPESGYMAMGKQSLFADLVTRAKSEFVGPDGSKFQTINIEQLVAWNPDAIVVPKYELDKMVADPALKAVPAVAQGRILGINADILLRNGGRVDQLLEGLTIGIGRIVDLRGDN